jgi:hypothetical protein
MPGITAEGFETKTIDEIEAEIKQDMWDTIDPQFDLSPESPDGQQVSIYADREANIWQALEAVYQARRVDGARGTALTQTALITGTKRKTKSRTIGTSQVNIDAGFSRAPGEMIAHLSTDPTKRFVNKDAVVNPGGAPATIDAVFWGETAGAIECLSGKLTVIAEPLTGWNSITNALDFVTGDDDETDPQLYRRREDELQAQGSAVTEAIRSAILRNLADNITHCLVLENDGDSIDANGLPPHSIEVIVRGKDTGASETDRLVKQIFALKTGGIKAFSGLGSYENVIDSKGRVHSIGYSWVVDTNVYVEIDVRVGTDYPLDGDIQVTEAVVAVEDGYSPSDPVVAEKLKSVAFAITGLKDVVALRLGFAVSPVGTTNLTIGLRNIAALDSSRVLVTQV